MRFPPFYVSSFGGSATYWFASSLSMHPDIVCLHGTRSIPPKPNGTNDIPPKPFVDGLVDLHLICCEQKLFGAVHGYHGVDAKDAIDAHGGVLATIVRHPIRRIHSLCTHHLKHLVDGEPDNIYTGLVAAGQVSAAPNMQANASLSEGENLFMWLCEGAFRWDMESITGLPPDHIFKMENFTRNPDEWRRVIAVLSQNALGATDEYLDAVYSQGKKNAHAKKSLTPTEIHDCWPPVFRLFYYRALHKHGFMALYELYHTFGYEMPTVPDSIEMEGVRYHIAENRFEQ